MLHVYLDQTMKVFESTMAPKICVRYFSKTPPDSAAGGVEIIRFGVRDWTPVSHASDQGSTLPGGI